MNEKEEVIDEGMKNDDINNWKDIPIKQGGELLESRFEKWKNFPKKYDQEGKECLVEINMISRRLIQKIEMEENKNE